MVRGAVRISPEAPYLLQPVQARGGLSPLRRTCCCRASVPSPLFLFAFSSPSSPSSSSLPRVSAIDRLQPRPGVCERLQHRLRLFAAAPAAAGPCRSRPLRKRKPDLAAKSVDAVLPSSSKATDVLSSVAMLLLGYVIPTCLVLRSFPVSFLLADSFPISFPVSFLVSFLYTRDDCLQWAMKRLWQ